VTRLRPFGVESSVLKEQIMSPNMSLLKWLKIPFSMLVIADEFAPGFKISFLDGSFDSLINLINLLILLIFLTNFIKLYIKVKYYFLIHS